MKNLTIQESKAEGPEARLKTLIHYLKAENFPVINSIPSEAQQDAAIELTTWLSVILQQNGSFYICAQESCYNARRGKTECLTMSMPVKSKEELIIELKKWL